LRELRNVKDGVATKYDPDATMAAAGGGKVLRFAR